MFDSVWNALWSEGAVNPLTAIEQITYLLFLRRRDDLQTLAELRANRAGEPMARRIFGRLADDAGTRARDHLTELDALFASLQHRVFSGAF